jgi:hypothetical protein
MCVLCAEIQKDRLTVREIARNYREITDVESDHWVEILVELEKKGLTEKVAEELSELYKKDGWR